MNTKLTAHRRCVRMPLVRTAMALSLSVTCMAASAAGPMTVGGTTLKTPLPDSRMVGPLIDALLDFDEAVDQNGGRAPKDTAKRIAAIDADAKQALPEIRRLASRLKANGETQLFNAYIAESVHKLGSPRLASEMKALDGNAYGLLLKSDSYIEDEIEQRRALKVGWNPAAVLLSLAGIAPAEASLRSGACSFFWWVVSAGQGTTHAYTSCYKYSS